jgi:hypothetical protein
MGSVVRNAAWLLKIFIEQGLVGKWKNLHLQPVFTREMGQNV